MINLPLFNAEGKSGGEIKASKEVFGRKPNEHVVHSALVWFLASKRRGTHNTKTCGEVSGGGKKPWKQKGTGRARAGSNRSPLWRKGGVVFGPKPRGYGYNLPQKMRKLALKVALSDKAREGKLLVVQEFKLSGLKTKLAEKLLKEMKVSGKALVVLGQESAGFIKASRNLKGIKPVLFGDVNIFDVLNAEWVLAEKSVIAKMEEGLA